MITASPELTSKYGHIIRKQVDKVLPAWVLDNFSLELLALNEKEATFELAYNPDLYRKIPDSPKTLMSGQAVMALADSLLIFPVMVKVGQEREMVTLNTSTEFLQPIPTGTVTIKAEVIRAGSKVVRGQVKLYNEDNKLSAITTLCYIYI